MSARRGVVMRAEWDLDEDAVSLPLPVPLVAVAVVAAVAVSLPLPLLPVVAVVVAVSVAVPVPVPGASGGGASGGWWLNSQQNDCGSKPWSQQQKGRISSNAHVSSVTGHATHWPWPQQRCWQ